MATDAPVIVNLAMSLDGFIAFPDDSVGPLFDWYTDGPVEVEAGGMTFRMSETSAQVFREALDAVGALLVGRRLYDLTGGWGGRPPVDAPMVVLTHEAPDDWPRDGVPITFATGGVEEAVTEAKRLAGSKAVSVAGGAAARACLEAGLLDELYVNLVPIAISEGIPLLAGLRTAPVRFEDPEVVEAPGVTHLRYRVRR